jgi:hypothetical protein
VPCSASRVVSEAHRVVGPGTHQGSGPREVHTTGGNNDTKCLYFPFCLDQAPLTWVESLEKYSIDKWDQLKEQFTSNFVGAMGCSGTRMDLAMVK